MTLQKALSLIISKQKGDRRLTYGGCFRGVRTHFYNTLCRRLPLGLGLGLELRLGEDKDRARNMFSIIGLGLRLRLGLELDVTICPVRRYLAAVFVMRND